MEKQQEIKITSKQPDADRI